MMKTVVMRSLIRIPAAVVSGVSGPPAVKTIKIPITPKAIEAYMKIRVAIFCIAVVYQKVIIKGQTSHARL